MNNSKYEELIKIYQKQAHTFEIFRNGVLDSFRLEPDLNGGNYGDNHSIIHSIKSRLKNPANLLSKIIRKEQENEGREINSENIFQEITDFAGIRILHLYQDQFPIIHNFIMNKISNGDWSIREKPIAYSWDPDSSDFLKTLGLEVTIKPSHYTSIHYVIQPPNNNDVTCEIQVRTLFEEIWGEIDHTINYPKKTENFASREQLRVLSKLVSTGTRLADAIFRIENNSK